MPTKKTTTTKDDAKTIQKKQEELKKIGKKFLAEIEKLKQKQDEILLDYMKALEKAKIEKIKKSI